MALSILARDQSRRRNALHLDDTTPRPRHRMPHIRYTAFNRSGDPRIVAPWLTFRHALTLMGASNNRLLPWRLLTWMYHRPTMRPRRRSIHLRGLPRSHSHLVDCHRFFSRVWLLQQPGRTLHAVRCPADLGVRRVERQPNDNQRGECDDIRPLRRACHTTWLVLGRRLHRSSGDVRPPLLLCSVAVLCRLAPRDAQAAARRATFMRGPHT